MNRLVLRLATVAATVPFALGATALTAHATESINLLPGCYGAGAAVICDVTVTAGVPAGVGTYQTTVPVCAGTCTYVPVTLVTVTGGDPLLLCVSYHTLTGPVVSECVDETTVDGVVDTAVTVAENAIALAEQRVCLLLAKVDITCDF